MKYVFNSAVGYCGLTVVQKEVISIQNAKGLSSGERECTKFEITVEVPQEMSLIYQIN